MDRDLNKLLASGQLDVGAELFHPFRHGRSGEVTARIAANGLEIDGKLYPSPSTAAGAVAGHACNGWTYWRLRTTGALIDTLRRREV
jgi:hypothetical protein